MRGRVTTIDWIMLALAVVSVGLVAYETWGDPNEAQRRQVLLFDLVIIGIFALEFAVRWARDDRPRTFLARNWYDLLGMIPVAHPAVRGFRLFRLVRIVVLLSRFGRAADRAFGQEFTYRAVRRAKNILVEVIGDAVTVRVLDETLGVLQKGSYAATIADQLEEHGARFQALVSEKVRADPQLGRVRHLPFFDETVAAIGRVGQRLLVDLLRDPRTDAMVKDIIRANVVQIRAAVQEKEALRRS